MALRTGAEPFEADGGPVGVVVSHGFTGSPYSVRPWAEHLAAAGHAVSLPLLPGHGTRWEDMVRTRWTDWYDAVEQAYLRLRGSCDQVFVAGLSMGGALALRIAEQHPDVAGIVLVNPSLGTERRDLRLLLPVVPAVHRLVRSVPGITDDIRKPGVSEYGYARTPVRSLHTLARLWRTVLADLPAVTAPILLFRSRVDHVVEPLSGRLLRERASGTEVTERILEDSYHVATLDNDAPRIFAESAEWIAARTRAGGPLGAPTGTDPG